MYYTIEGRLYLKRYFLQYTVLWERKMKSIKLDAYGKINLSLDVLRRRDDGYHDLRMIMQQIDLKDTVAMEEIEEDRIVVESDSPEIPTDERNIVYRVADALKKKYGLKSGVKISIEKRIPVSAGLAGGSTDAAATLRGLNELWGLGLSDIELMELGKPIGADIPYCIYGGTALAEGIGEKLTRLRGFGGKHILLANPEIQVSTARIYQNLNLEGLNKRPDTEKLMQAITEDDLEYVARNMVNVLETVTIPMHPVISEIKQDMISSGAIGALMSGSGPTVFGIFKTEKELDESKAKLEKKVKLTIKTKTI